MGIVIGDIVKRKERTSDLDSIGVSPDVYSLFYDGYFIVVDVMISSLSSPLGCQREESICKIMNSSGEMSWISMEYLFKI
tara:strand:- start:48 stop:287 length:240 start_codon:yes stop_codon:yes gene_type:complete